MGKKKEKKIKRDYISQRRDGEREGEGELLRAARLYYTHEHTQRRIDRTRKTRSLLVRSVYNKDRDFFNIYKSSNRVR